MSSLKDYQERINTLAKAKGWSDDLHWLQLGMFKEVGELVQAMEHFEDIDQHDKGDQISQDLKYEQLNAIEKEFGDVCHFLFQAMHHFNINLDEALEFVIKDNSERKKKTIDSEGNIVRK